MTCGVSILFSGAAGCLIVGDGQVVFSVCLGMTEYACFLFYGISLRMWVWLWTA